LYPSSGHWLTIAETADLYRVHPATIRRRIADGTLTAKRFGPRLLRVWIEDNGGDRDVA